MRTLFIVFVLILVGLKSNAQAISGTVTDPKGNPISGATVSLLNATDSTAIKLQISKEDGSFNFTGIPSGTYRVNSSFVGYASRTTPLFHIIASDMKLPDMSLELTTKKMNEVVVTTKKPLVQIKGDRMIINVEGTINATGNNTLELLRKSPGVNVDGDERISMNGKNGVQIFIDGRPSPLAGSDLAAYLKSLPSSEVEAIELINNPSAKYEAAGNAGIINIRLKKNKAFGTNGSINFDYNQGLYSRFNNGMSINHRSAKMNVFGTYNYNAGTFRKDITMNRILLDSAFNQHGVLTNKSKTHNIKVGTDYFVSKNSTIGFVMNGNFSNSPLDNTSKTIISYIPTRETDRTLFADNTSDAKRDNMSFNLNYQYTTSDAKSLNVNADHSFYNINSSQLQPNTYFNKFGVQTSQIIYETEAPSDIHIYSMKADYEQPFKKGKLALGFKTSYVKTDNDFKRFNVLQPAREMDRVNSNHFIYKENINAAYINYNRSYKKIAIEAGLRAENTVVIGRSIGARKQQTAIIPFDSTIHQNYLNLFPAVAFNYTKDGNNQFRLSLNKRIDRPAYQDLNPFEIKVDDYLVQKGNPYLRPQYTKSIALAWVYKQKLNASIQYNQVKDISTWLADTTETSKSMITKRNLAGQRLVTMTFSYPYQYKNYSLFANLTTSYSKFNADFGADRTINEQGFGVNLFVQNSMKFAKKWMADVTAFYNSPTLQEGNMRTKSLWSIDAGVQTKMLKDKATLKFAVSDIFQSLRFANSSEFAGQKVSYNATWNSQQAKLSIAFKLGSADVKAARQRKTAAEEEMKRVQ